MVLCWTIGSMLNKTTWNILINHTIYGIQKMQGVLLFINCNYQKQAYMGHWNCFHESKGGNEQIKLWELRGIQYLDLWEESFDEAPLFN